MQLRGYKQGEYFGETGKGHTDSAPRIFPFVFFNLCSQVGYTDKGLVQYLL
jgi:hypothetical protein